ncbi:MAG TPA: carboxypeptidase M32 [Candidatus Bathyarchaeia archaeon]|nr:carboxypeptidase M32 [Candidatus Bathyarchaeia archaeon]
MATDIDTLREMLGSIADIRSALALLEWDQETHMPPRGGDARANQIATVSAIAHREFTNPALGDILDELHDKAGEIDPDDAVLVAETLYDYNRARKLPERFVQELAQEQSRAFQTWVKARAESNWPLFRPHLEKIVDLLRQKAEFLGYQGSPYNALLEEFERGMTAEQLREIFNNLGARQSKLVKEIADSGRQPGGAWLDQHWQEQVQWDFTMLVLKDLGFNLQAGRQDKSLHPFTTTIDITDVRITTRIDSRNPFKALDGTVHEFGHALYEQNFLEKDRGTPLANAPSLGLHESQSLGWENMIGRSLPFWTHYTPLLQQQFPGHLDNVTAQQVYRVVNRVEPSLIRVDADECTYNLHIIVRFEIETALIEGKMNVAEVPEAWNAKVKQYLSIDVPDDAHGCLQDVHWAHAAMGYFPSYALGNLYAAQMFEVIQRDLPNLWDNVREAEFGPLREWLRGHVHVHGRRKTARQLVKEISGKEPSSEPYLSYLETKYSKLYGL